VLAKKLFLYHIIDEGVKNVGRQVRFFMTEKDELLFWEKVRGLDYSIFDNEGNTFTVEEASSSNKLSLYLALEDADIVKRGEFIEQIESEVIQFSRCRCWRENILEPGRIWAEFKYWNSQDELTTKSNKFTERYNVLAKWLKKTMKLSTDKSYYIGEHAYKLYQERQYIMQAGPKYIVEF